MAGNHRHSTFAASQRPNARRVAVVGAGPVGLAAALGLAGSGFTVTLIGPPSARRDGRTAALLAGSLALLERIGAWVRIAADSAPLEAIRIVDDTGSLFRPPPVTFHAREIGFEAFGRNVENATLAERLGDAVRADTRVAWTARLATGLAQPGSVLLDDGSTVEADLVVAADGRSSPIRQSAGLPSQTRRYDQRAVTTLLDHSLPHDNVSTEFHTRGGPFTLVPLPGNRSSLVWAMPPTAARRITVLPHDALAATIERQSHGILGHIRIAGPVASVPLGLVSVPQIVSRRLVLIGEAAHALPPIGAQGLNLGFADVSALLACLSDIADPGDEQVLAAYARARRGDLLLRTGAVDALNRSLLTDFLPVDALRGLGLATLGRSALLRRAAMRAGFAGGLSVSRSEAAASRNRSSASR